MKKRLEKATLSSVVGFVALVALMILLVGVSRAADIPKPTRDTPYDWRCVDSSGVAVANRQRQDLAVYDCIDAASKNPGKTYYIEGGRYRVVSDSPSPPPPPPVALANLSWTPPTQNCDGSPVTASIPVTGFRIYYGPVGRVAAGLPALSPGGPCSSHVQPSDPKVPIAYPFKLDVDGVTTTAQSINIQPGTTYFAVSALSATGESPLSNEVSKTL